MVTAPRLSQVESDDDDDLLGLTLGEVLDILLELREEIERQRNMDALWDRSDQWNLERLKLELRILHAIIERDENLEDFRKARGILFFD